MLVDEYQLCGNVEECLRPVMSGKIEPKTLVLSEDCVFSVKARLQLINAFVCSPRLTMLSGVIAKKTWPLMSAMVAKITQERWAKFKVHVHVAGGLPTEDEMNKYNDYIRNTTDFEVDIEMQLA